MRENFPRIGGLILALTDVPQSSKAWDVGARGEELLGAHIDSTLGTSALALHDRRIPRTRANIDHIVICPSGVFVVDAKKYTGRPNLRVEGGLFNPRTERLMVGSRDCSKLVVGMRNQVDLVIDALAVPEFEHVPVTGVLCFVEADWPLIGGDFVVDGVEVMWPKMLNKLINQPGEIEPERVEKVARLLAARFPTA